MRKFIFFSVALSLFAAAPVSAEVPMRSFKNCTALKKVYPRGVANTKKAAKLTGAKYAPSIYKANKKMDRDGDNAACES
jgi:predicted peptidase